MLRFLPPQNCTSWARAREGATHSLRDTITDVWSVHGSSALCLLSSDLHSDRSVGWIAKTFVEGEDAETELSIDRPRFVQRQDIMKLIPRSIKKHITHPGDNGQIHGFEELFVYLERSSASEELRRLIIDYFARSPTLRGHLSQLSTALLI
jgi:hypothetical protein